MCDKIYFVDVEQDSKNRIKNLYKKMFNKLDLIDLQCGRFLVKTATDYLDKKLYVKLLKSINSNNIKFIVSNKIRMDTAISSEYRFNGKILMKQMILKILHYIEQAIDINMKQEAVYVTLESDKYTSFIIELGKKCKNINIVTDKIKKLSRMQYRLSNDEDILCSIQNNKKKSLKRAKILINFDQDSNFFQNFCYNKNCIIINLHEKNLCLKKSFQGTIIEGINIDGNKIKNLIINQENYEKIAFYESYTYNLDYNRAQKIINAYNIKIKALVGQNSTIERAELKNNYIKSTRKLDKIIKKG